MRFGSSRGVPREHRTDSLSAAFKNLDRDTERDFTKRYAVGRERNEYLFDVQFPNKRPGAAGTIAVNSDFDKQGKSVDIYEIRVSIAE